MEHFLLISASAIHFEKRCLVALPASLFAPHFVEQLCYLDLSRNRLQVVPPAIGTLTALKTLYLDRNLLGNNYYLTLWSPIEFNELFSGNQGSWRILNLKSFFSQSNANLSLTSSFQKELWRRYSAISSIWNDLIYKRITSNPCQTSSVLSEDWSIFMFHKTKSKKFHKAWNHGRIWILLEQSFNGFIHLL